MKILLSFILVLILGACSGDPRTRYGAFKEKNKGGYTLETVNSDLRKVTFRANSQTPRNTAELLGRFRAIELCQREGKKYAHLLGVLDRSESREVTRSNSHMYGFPSYYYGYSPFYSRYSGIGFSAGLNTVSTNTWNETLIYPHYDILFRCSDGLYEPDVIFREVPASEMKHLVKDLKGALQVEKVMENSPNKNLKPDDILLRASGERVSQNWQLLEKFRTSESVVPVQILREGKTLQLNLKGRSVGEEGEASQQETIRAACKFDEVKERPLCK